MEDYNRILVRIKWDSAFKNRVGSHNMLVIIVITPPHHLLHPLMSLYTGAWEEDASGTRDTAFLMINYLKHD